MANKVSIQRSLDGHSFSVPPIETLAPDAAHVEAEVITPQTLLVPREAFDPELAAELLAAAGMACTEGQHPVWSAPKTLGPETEVVAVMAIDSAVLQALRERTGDRAEFTDRKSVV